MRKTRKKKTLRGGTHLRTAFEKGRGRREARGKKREWKNSQEGEGQWEGRYYRKKRRYIEKIQKKVNSQIEFALDRFKRKKEKGFVEKPGKGRRRFKKEFSPQGMGRKEAGGFQGCKEGLKQPGSQKRVGFQEDLSWEPNSGGKFRKSESITSFW